LGREKWAGKDSKILFKDFPMNKKKLQGWKRFKKGVAPKSSPTIFTYYIEKL